MERKTCPCASFPGSTLRCSHFRFAVPSWRCFLAWPRWLLALVASVFLGREFMPKLEEGNFWIRATLPMSISLEKAGRLVGRMRAIVRGCPSEDDATCSEGQQRRPEIQTAISQLGRPDDGTYATGACN